MDTTQFTASFLTIFGESAVYTKASGATRAITVVVDRQSATSILETPSAMRPDFQAWVANNVTTGITASELETSTDTLTIPKRVGGTNEVFAIGRIVTQDDGMLSLELR